ncbi:MAG TPA: hypothetical protein ENJ56_05575 [Anaerolineae bacterium]|nr:hypothetical protein [Anaerolineae bacterium]
MHGARVVQQLFAHNQHPNLRGHLIWLPVLSADNQAAAEKLANSIHDPRITLYWNADQSLGLPLRATLQLCTPVAWDVYLLYPAQTVWRKEATPQPAFWMHQLSAETHPNWLDAAELAIQLDILLIPKKP